MLLVVIGITYGSAVGFFGHWMLFRKMAANRRSGLEPLTGVGTVFFMRYVIDLAALLGFALVTKDALGITATAVSITIAVKVSLFIVYARKGGRFG